MKNSEEKVTRLLVKPETGEVLDSLYPGDRIVRKSSIDEISNYQVWRVEKFFKGHIGEIRETLKELSTTEKAFLFSIVPYVGYDDCCLRYDNGNELNFDSMVEISGLSRSTVSEVLNSLIAKDILYRGRNSQSRQYFMNPWLFSKGNRINRILKRMFKNYRIKVIGGRRWKDVSDEEAIRIGG